MTPSCVIAAFLFRTKQERRPRVPWLRADVFLERKVGESIAL